VIRIKQAHTTASCRTQLHCSRNQATTPPLSKGRFRPPCRFIACHLTERYQPRSCNEPSTGTDLTCTCEHIHEPDSTSSNVNLLPPSSGPPFQRGSPKICNFLTYPCSMTCNTSTENSDATVLHAPICLALPHTARYIAAWPSHIPCLHLHYVTALTACCLALNLVTMSNGAPRTVSSTSITGQLSHPHQSHKRSSVPCDESFASCQPACY
jgi:hypothetical protein